MSEQKQGTKQVMCEQSFDDQAAAGRWRVTSARGDTVGGGREQQERRLCSSASSSQQMSLTMLI